MDDISRALHGTYVLTLGTVRDYGEDAASLLAFLEGVLQMSGKFHEASLVAAQRESWCRLLSQLIAEVQRDDVMVGTCLALFTFWIGVGGARANFAVSVERGCAGPTVITFQDANGDSVDGYRWTIDLG